MELGSRLECALSFVRANSIIYDIGSDHGYLPMELVRRGICSGAVVTDVNKGPLERAVATFTERELTECVSFFLTDGLTGLTFDSFPADVCICGMGGELIASIMEKRADIWQNDIRFILQPMTKAEELRRFLWENGFEILKEKAVCEGDKTYVVINAVHTGRVVPYDEVQLYTGKEESCILCRESAVLYDRIIASLEKKRDGLKRAGQRADRLDSLIAAVKSKREGMES